MTLESKVKQLLELSAKATPGEWYIGHVSETEDSADIDSEFGHIANVQMRIDQSFICTANPDTIIRLCESWLNMKEALEFYAQGGNSNMDIWKHEELGYFTGKHARECLAKIEGGE